MKQRLITFLMMIALALAVSGCSKGEEQEASAVSDPVDTVTDVDTDVGKAAVDA